MGVRRDTVFLLMALVSTITAFIYNIQWVMTRDDSYINRATFFFVLALMYMALLIYDKVKRIEDRLHSMTPQ